MTSEEMQRNAEEDYEEHSGALPSNSVYDFLYQDVRRVASFLSQFEEHGFRSAVKATESAGRAQAVKGAATGQVGVPLVANASANIDVTTTDDTKDIAEHTFDPLWANSRRLLNYLDEHDLIERDLNEAQIGRFVIVTGSVSILDLGLLTPMLEDESLRSAFSAAALVGSGIQPGTAQAIEFDNNLRVAMKFPKSVQLFVFGDQGGCWATLTNESLVTSAHDIGFKHGALIRGYWSVLGILDAWPDTRPTPTEAEPNPQTLDELGEAAIPEGFAKVAAKFTNAGRAVLGRPRTSFGITPLLIFREVSG